MLSSMFETISLRYVLSVIVLVESAQENHVCLADPLIIQVMLDNS